ncbi:unnamed protein product [Leptosia nina]|uniref:CHK kinase-like domain-containing protein n=1 Tax=Leptosia nina TaxID=320188 RepID=A0AAV1JLG1_9NEOP
METTEAKSPKMAEQDETLRQVLNNIAKERGYTDYDISTKPTTTEGANYSSVLFLAKITEKGKDDLKLFAKVACVGEKVREVAPLEVFKTEIFFYTNLVKTYREIELRHGVPEDERLVTTKFYGSNDEYLKETLVMEDLTAKGYEMFDRFTTFDWEYAKEAIKQLAKLHALSITYSLEKPEEFEKKTESLVIKFNADCMQDMMKGNIANSMTAVKEEYKDRVEKFFEEMMSAEKFFFLTQAHKRLVLAHGDYRPSNLMHKLNEDGTYSIIPIDYQTLNRGNPIVDLLYLIYNGSDQQFRRAHLDEAFDYYHSELSASLQRFGLKPDDVYSKDDFDFDLQQVRPYGLLISFMLLLLVTVDLENIPTVSGEADFTAFNIKPSETYKKRINEIIEEYIELGVL